MHFFTEAASCPGKGRQESGSDASLSRRPSFQRAQSSHLSSHLDQTGLHLPDLFLIDHFALDSAHHLFFVTQICLYSMLQDKTDTMKGSSYTGPERAVC